MDWADYSVSGEFEALVHTLEHQLAGLLAPAENNKHNNKIGSAFFQHVITLKKSDIPLFDVLHARLMRSEGTHADSADSPRGHFLSFGDEVALLRRLDSVARGSVGSTREQQLALLTGFARFCMAKPTKTSQTGSGTTGFTGFGSSAVGRSAARYRLSLLMNAMQHFVAFGNAHHGSANAIRPLQTPLTDAEDTVQTLSDAPDSSPSTSERSSPRPSPLLDCSPALPSPALSSPLVSFPLPILSTVHEEGRGAVVGMALRKRDKAATQMACTPAGDIDYIRTRCDCFAPEEGSKAIHNARLLLEKLRKETVRKAADLRIQACGRYDWTLCAALPTIAVSEDDVDALPRVARQLQNLLEQLQHGHQLQFLPVCRFRDMKHRYASDFNEYVRMQSPLRSVALRCIISDDDVAERLLSRATDASIGFADVFSRVNGIAVRAFWQPFESCTRTTWLHSVRNHAEVVSLVRPTVWTSLVECEAASTPLFAIGDVSATSTKLLDAMLLHEALLGYQAFNSTLPILGSADRTSSTFEGLYNTTYAEFLASCAPVICSSRDASCKDNHDAVMRQIGDFGECVSALPQYGALCAAVDAATATFLEAVHPVVYSSLESFLDDIDILAPNEAATLCNRRLVCLLGSLMSAFARTDLTVRSICKDAHVSLYDACTACDATDLRLAIFSVWMLRFVMARHYKLIWAEVLHHLKKAWGEVSTSLGHIPAWPAAKFRKLSIDWAASFLQQHLHVVCYLIMWGRHEVGLVEQDSSEKSDSAASEESEEILSEEFQDADVVSVSDVNTSGIDDSTSAFAAHDSVSGILLLAAAPGTTTTAVRPGVLSPMPPMTSDQADTEWRLLKRRGLGLTALVVDPAVHASRFEMPGSRVNDRWLPSLVRSDMSAFKSANPSATLFDFFRWYFTDCFIRCTCQLSADAEESMAHKMWCGHFVDALGGAAVHVANPISATAAPVVQGGHSAVHLEAWAFWASLWESSRPLKAHLQPSLLNPLLAAELSLNLLETTDLALLIWGQLHEGLCIAVADGREILRAACDEGVGADSVEEAIQTKAAGVASLSRAQARLNDGAGVLRNLVVMSESSRPSSPSAAAQLPSQAQQDLLGASAAQVDELVSLAGSYVAWIVPLAMDIHTFSFRVLALRALTDGSEDSTHTLEVALQLAAVEDEFDETGSHPMPWHAGWHLDTPGRSATMHTCVAPQEICVPSDDDSEHATLWSRLKAFASLQYKPLQAGRLRKRGIAGPLGSATAEDASSPPATADGAGVTVSLHAADVIEAVDLLQEGDAFFPTPVGPECPLVSSFHIGCKALDKECSLSTHALRPRDIWLFKPIPIVGNHNGTSNDGKHSIDRALQCSSLVWFNSDAQLRVLSRMIETLSFPSRTSRSKPQSANAPMPPPDSRMWIFRQSTASTECSHDDENDAMCGCVCRVAVEIGSDGSVALGHTTC